MKIVCTGSRGWNASDVIVRRFRALPQSKGTHIIVGEAKGADEMVALEALRRGFTLTVVKAEWQEYGKRAGPRRNRLMLDMLDPANVHHLVLAFQRGESPGTTDTIREAKRRGLALEIHWRP